MYILSILKSKRKTDAEFVGIKLHPFSSVEKVNSRQDFLLEADLHSYRTYESGIICSVFFRHSTAKIVYILNAWCNG